MKPEIEIRLDDYLKDLPESDRTQFEKYLDDVINQLVKQSEESGFWEERIKKIIITDNYSQHIYEQAFLWGINTKAANTREFLGAAKNLCNTLSEQKEIHLFIPHYILSLETNNVTALANTISFQCLFIKADNLIPSDIRDLSFEKVNFFQYNEVTKTIVSSWISHGLTFHLAKTYNLLVSKEGVKHKDLFNTFSRNLKTNFYHYNSSSYGDHKDVGRIWENSIIIFHNFILRVIENYYQRDELFFIESEPDVSDAVNNVLVEVMNCMQQVLDKEVINFELCETLFLKLVKLFDFNLTIEDNKIEAVKFATNPKYHIVSKAIETELRLVCFMDILGFSKMIENYSEDEYSNLLVEIKDVFDEAMKTLKYRPDNIDSEALDTIDIKTFSDNICISIPFFDNQNDFEVNLRLMLIYVSGLQYQFMTKGFYLRGGLTVGGYYSDNNIIFSNALVEAYKLESKYAIYPRVILSEAILDKIREIDTPDVWTTLLVSDWESVWFINPFKTIEHSQKVLINSFSDVLNSFDDDDFLKPLKPLIEPMNSFMEETFNNAESAMEKEFQKILLDVQSQLISKSNPKEVSSKYLWLLEFMNWQSGNESSLKFQNWKNEKNV
jgi:hypothetical protein